MPGPSDEWNKHEHEALVHSHGHYHVTHNHLEATGGVRAPELPPQARADHAAVRHRHYPHQDFDSEHQGEAHVHDHDAAVAPEHAGAAGAGKRSGRAPS